MELAGTLTAALTDVVHQHIDASEALPRPRDRLLHRRVSRAVGLQGDDLAPAGAHLLGDLLERLCLQVQQG
jgi:hypothetical protein